MTPEDLWKAFVAALAKANWPWLKRAFRCQGYSDAEIEDAIVAVLSRLLRRNPTSDFRIWVERELISMRRRERRSTRLEDADEIIEPERGAPVETIESLGPYARRCAPRLVLPVRLSTSARFRQNKVASLLGIKPSSVPVLKSKGMAAMRRAYHGAPDGPTHEPTTRQNGKHARDWESRIGAVIERAKPHSASLADEETERMFALWLWWFTEEQIAAQLKIASEIVQERIWRVLEELGRWNPQAEG